MKIWIAESGGSGKTTLSNRIAGALKLEVIHRDQISWMENWVLRDEKDQIQMIKDLTSKDQWIFDGNKFSASKEDGRFETVDVLIHLNTHPLLCFIRTLVRYLKHKNKPRQDLAKGCDEDLDLNHLKYILYDYPKAKKKRKEFFELLKEKRPEVIIISDKKDLKFWLQENNI